MIYRSTHDEADVSVRSRMSELRLLLPDDVMDQDFASLCSWNQSGREQGRQPCLLSHYGDENE
jgi:hypothetical protein